MQDVCLELFAIALPTLCPCSLLCLPFAFLSCLGKTPSRHFLSVLGPVFGFEVTQGGPKLVQTYPQLAPTWAPKHQETSQYDLQSHSEESQYGLQGIQSVASSSRSIRK